MIETEVAVVGAGPAGSIAARGLARHGVDVLLVDLPSPSPLGIGEYVPSSLRPLLGELGLDVLDGHQPSAGRVSVWNGAVTEHASIDDPLGSGVVLDRARFDAALRTAAREAGARWHEARVRSVQASPEGIVLDGSIRARFVIDATGRGATVARALNARVEHDTPSFAWCRWQRDAHVDRRVFIEATDDGWWYTAPLPDQRRAVVWHRTDAGRVDAERFDVALGATRAVAERARGEWLEGLQGRPTNGQRTVPVCGPGWWAVGDAALACDPISGQGIHTAVYTGWQGAQAVLDALDAGCPGVERYRRQVEGIRRRYLQGMRRLR